MYPSLLAYDFRQASSPSAELFHSELLNYREGKLWKPNIDVEATAHRK